MSRSCSRVLLSFLYSYLSQWDCTGEHYCGLASFPIHLLFQKGLSIPHFLKREDSTTHLPFLVTIISFVTSLNLCHRAASSKTTWSCFSVGSPLSLPACSSFSTTLSSLEMVQSLCFLQPKSVMGTSMSETSQMT